MDARVIQVRGKGTVTLPIRVRDRYRLQDGDPLTLVDLDGGMLLAPRVGVVAKLAAEIESQARRASVASEDLLEGIRQERKSGNR
jgi:bifunctional DNA-binding transcriptional regulator/antitoxin component of YhaV-PrlF toxin-antitoxin module